MSWNEQRARERVAKHDFHDFEVKVSDLSREMDFDNLGTHDVRRVVGAHIYADVPNFHRAVADAGADKQKQRKLLRAASVLRRMQRHLLAGHDIGALQLQAARLHCLNFKPYGDGDEEAERAERAVVLAVMLNSYLYDVFNPVFADVRDFSGAVGVAAGRSLIANVGFHGDRELISLGTSANLGAKVLAGVDAINITEEVYELLPGCLQEHFSKDRILCGAAVYRSEGLRWRRHPGLAEELEVKFDADKLRAKTEEHRDALPLAEMQIGEANVLIDPDSLTERNNKRTSVVVLFVDVDGFTRHVQEAEENDQVVSLVRTLHMIRRELHAVVKQDYPGLVIQHQGDRIVAVVHLPPGDDGEKRCRNGVDAAIGVQSSMEHVLNERLSSYKGLHVAVGVDTGAALVTRLGKKGERETVCLGPEVTNAERLQLRSSGEQIRISKKVYESLKEETLKDQFSKSGDAYLAEGVTFPRLDALEEEKAAKENRLSASLVPGGIWVREGRDVPVPRSVNSKPWLSR
jgi:class 3 adenylate cyclase